MARRLKKKAKRRLLLVSTLLVVLIGFVCFNFFGSDSVANLDSPLPNLTKPKEEPIKTYKASLIATGDGLIHTAVYKAAYNEATGEYDFSDMLTYTKDKLKDYDIKYYNQETVFDSTSSLQSYPSFNTPSAFGQNMLDAGFNLVSLASNHSMDMGATGAKVSASWWEGKEGILATGMATSQEKSDEHKIMNANGITYTMLNYTYNATNAVASRQA